MKKGSLAVVVREDNLTVTKRNCKKIASKTFMSGHRRVISFIILQFYFNMPNKITGTLYC